MRACAVGLAGCLVEVPLDHVRSWQVGPAAAALLQTLAT